MYHVSAKHRGKKLFSSSKNPEWPWDLHNFLFTGECGLVSRP